MSFSVQSDFITKKRRAHFLHILSRFLLVSCAAHISFISEKRQTRVDSRKILGAQICCLLTHFKRCLRIIGNLFRPT